MPDRPTYEVVVVGGGPAGLTAAIYATRLGHRTAVFEREGGRHAAVSHVHNLYGVSEDVSGRELSAHAVAQFEEYGGDFYLDPVRSIERGGGEGGGSDAGGAADAADGGRFRVETTYSTVAADRIVFATGFSDVEPSVPGIHRFAGRGLHYCLHCDAYTLGDGRVFVLGHDEHAARVAMLMLNFTADVDLLLDGEEPTWDESVERRLAAHPVDRVDGTVEQAFPESGADAGDGNPDASEDPWLGGLRFADGTEREYLGGFAMYGTEYNTALASALGCDLADDGALAVDDDYRTSVDGVYGVGDVTHGQNQTALALADGAAAGIALHKDLREFPRDVEDGETVPASAVPGAPPDLRRRMRATRERESHAGLRGPPPDR